MRAVVLVDGEHYPPVTLQAIDHLRARFDVVAAAFIGGIEKIGSSLTLGDLPVVVDANQRVALETAIDRFDPEVVIDVSDAPVLDNHKRFVLASVALARGVAYEGAGFRFDVPPRPRLTTRPTVSIIGTGKRTGKTAVAATFARHAVARNARPVIVAMGRGGPAEPVVVRSSPTVSDLVALSDRGEHAASDVYEDAVVAGVTTVGARRAGAGFSGATIFDTVAAAVQAAEAEEPDVIILEGSGTSVPPARADATILVVGGGTPPGEILYGMGPYRLLIADLALVTMAEEPVLSSETVSALSFQISELARDIPIVRTVFRPAPVGSVRGRSVYFATTAPEAVGPALVRHLEDAHGAKVVGITHRLADRAALAADLSGAGGTYEVLLTELKAAAVDVAARAALAAGAEVAFADNILVAGHGAVADSFDAILRTAGVPV
ncbi:MAG TPA: cyclic 2,3-diphosphoglycerate synthetase [Actinomycetota bacterium]|nr:cyclic 2,3-diphosphoglycerate synthetase [Actinomycetota bacterium]